MTTGIIVTARQGSTRLPNKHLYPINGKRTALEVMLHRLDSMKGPTIKVLATTPHSPVLSELAKACGWQAWASEALMEEEVRARVLACAREYKIDTVVFVPGDQPLVDPWVGERCLEAFERGKDYVENTGPRGFCVRVLSRSLLEQLDQAIKDADEHVTTPFSHPLPCRTLLTQEVVTEVNFSLDTWADYQFLKTLIDTHGSEKTCKQYVEAAWSQSLLKLAATTAVG